MIKNKKHTKIQKSFLLNKYILPLLFSFVEKIVFAADQKKKNETIGDEKWKNEKKRK